MAGIEYTHVTIKVPKNLDDMVKATADSEFRSVDMQYQKILHEWANTPKYGKPRPTAMDLEMEDRYKDIGNYRG